MRGADLLIKSIVAAGIDKIFTLSGNQIMPIFDAAINSKIDLIHCRHEAAAVFMADGYAQTSGKVGIALVTAAPGFSNALGPLYAIRASQSPVLLLSGDSPFNQRNLMPFQELDQISISRGLVKKSSLIRKGNLIASEIVKGISIAKTGRPGPVHLALPFDLLNEEVKNISISQKEKYQQKLSIIDIKSKSLIFKLLKKSSKPLIITGPSLLEFRNKKLYDQINTSLNIPIISMTSPRGTNDPALGRIKTILEEADFIISIDKDIDFTLGNGSREVIKAESIVLLASEEKTISHAKQTLKERLKFSFISDPISSISFLIEKGETKEYYSWSNRVKKLLKERPKPLSRKGEKITPDALCRIVVNELEHIKDIIYISDGGEFGQWAQAAIPIQNLFTNGLSGAIGGAIPQAIGASLANPKSTIVSFMGDGTAGFQIAEWETARRFNLPIIYIIGNDRRWGAEVEIQKRDYGLERAKYCILDSLTRYDIIAKGFGCEGFFTNSESGLKKAIKHSLLTKKTTVIDIEMEGFPAPSFS